VVNYSGHLSSRRAAYLLADAVDRVDGIVLHAYGTVTDPAVRERLQASSRVRLDGIAAHAEAIRRMGEADIVSLLYDPCLPVVTISSANKMFEAMMMGRPYLCTAGTYPARIADRFGLGWSVPYGDVDAVANLLRWLRDNPEQLSDAGHRGRMAYERHFRWEHQRANLILLYELLRGKDIPTRPNDGWSRFLGSSSLACSSFSRSAPI
jgi:glycosyltransferase involved in cell wall biosynthesis